jgi:hypothetical protein
VVSGLGRANPKGALGPGTVLPPPAVPIIGSTSPSLPAASALFEIPAQPTPVEAATAARAHSAAKHRTGRERPPPLFADTLASRMPGKVARCDADLTGQRVAAFDRPGRWQQHPRPTFWGFVARLESRRYQLRRGFLTRPLLRSQRPARRTTTRSAAPSRRTSSCRRTEAVEPDRNLGPRVCLPGPLARPRVAHRRRPARRCRQHRFLHEGRRVDKRRIRSRVGRRSRREASQCCLSEPGPLSRSGVSGCVVLRLRWVRSFRGRPGLSGSTAAGCVPRSPFWSPRTSGGRLSPLPRL